MSLVLEPERNCTKSLFLATVTVFWLMLMLCWQSSQSVSNRMSLKVAQVVECLGCSFIGLGGGGSGGSGFLESTNANANAKEAREYDSLASLPPQNRRNKYCIIDRCRR